MPAVTQRATFQPPPRVAEERGGSAAGDICPPRDLIRKALHQRAKDLQKGGRAALTGRPRSLILTCLGPSGHHALTGRLRSEGGRVATCHALRSTSRHAGGRSAWA